jgi:NADPH-dependent glutamate synthase beta subunit-like oxidoreductase
VDAAVNIRGLKRFAVDQQGRSAVTVPEKGSPTGKSVGVVGGGPAGLTAAYFLSLMGHTVDVYERRKSLGGMLRYGIPSYRLPWADLQWDIDAILSTGGIHVHFDHDVAKTELAAIEARHDALFVAIGAHTEKRLGVEGENLRGVVSAVEMLRSLGDGIRPDLKGKCVLVVGGGNVAMDAARVSLRCGARSVKIVYRRRQSDMTALPEEVEGAVSEGCELVTLMAPVKITGTNEEAQALIVQPQRVGPIEGGRPKPIAADAPPVSIPCDLIVLAIGQDIEYSNFTDYGIPVKRGLLLAQGNCFVQRAIFAGGDCATGPATVIRAIEAGKVAARAIDSHLGFNHPISVDVAIPAPPIRSTLAWGRSVMRERPPLDRRGDFAHMELGLTPGEARQEAERCLRCDHCGYGAFRGGRVTSW